MGNVLFGGVIGLLIVDPATGAMYKPKREFIVAVMNELTANNSESGLQIYSIEDIPNGWEEHLVKVFH